MRLTFVVAAAALISTSLAARADTVLGITGNLQSGATFFGTINYSSDTGILGGPTFTSVDVTTSSGVTIDAAVYSVPESGGRNLTLSYLNPADGVQLFTNNDFPSGTGDTLCSLTYACGDDLFPGELDTSLIDGDKVVSGEITALAVTPEPSSFLLLGTGLLGVVGVVRKRFA